MVDIEEEFRRVSSKEIQTSYRRINDAKKNIEESRLEDIDIEPEEFLNSAGEHFGFALEHALKSNIIFDDFRRHARFSSLTNFTSSEMHKGQPIIYPAVGTPEWRAALAGDVDGLKQIVEPKDILKMIKEMNPSDERNES